MRLWGSIIGLFLASVFFVWFCYNGGTYDLVFSQQEIQQKVDEAIAKRTADPAPKRIVVDAATITLGPNDTLTLNAHIWGSFRHRMISTNISATGSPEYHSGSLYFFPTSLITFDNIRITKDDSPKSFPRTREMLQQKFHEFAEKHNLEAWTDALQKDFDEWSSREASVLIVDFLSKHPVYTLKNDFKGLTVKAVVEKVSVQGNNLHVTLSVVQLGYSLLLAMFCLMLAIGLTVVVIVCPELLLAFGFLS